MLLFSRHAKTIYLTLFGVFINSQESSSFEEMTKTGTALYVHGAKYIYPNKQINFNVLYFRETTNASFLSQVSKDVRHFSKDNFNATQALVISWINMRWHNYRSTTGDTFQLVLVTDDTRTYAIVIFHRSIVKLPLSGYVEEFCGRELFIKSTMDPRKTSNIGVPGKNVYLLTKKCLYAELYPFGISYNDKIMKKGKEIMEKLKLAIPIQLFGTRVLELYVHANGFISKTNKTLLRNIYPKSNHLFISIYAMDFNTSLKGQVFYREIFDTVILRRASLDIRKKTKKHFFANHAVIVTYVGVSTQKNPESENTFQLVLASDGNNSHTIFNYIRLDLAGATSGYQIRHYTERFLQSPKSSDMLARSSNIGIGGQFVLQVNLPCCIENRAVLYPYGISRGDFSIQLDLYYPTIENLILTKPMLLFSTIRWSLAIGSYGSLHMGDDSVNYDWQVPSHQTYLKVYHNRYNKGSIYCREIHSNKEELDLISKDINSYSNDNFAATHAICVTYFRMREYRTANYNTFQVAIASDGDVTYAVIKYIRIDSNNAQAGYNEPYCNSSVLIPPEKSRDLLVGSNTGRIGEYVMKLTSKCRAAELYPHGSTVGDLTMAKGSDTIEHFVLSRPMLLFSRLSRDIHISVKGVVSVDERVHGVLTEVLGQNTVVSAYSFDMDLTLTGDVFYRETFETGILAAVSNDVVLLTKSDFIANHAVIITFLNVPAKITPIFTHTFQVIFASDGRSTYLIINYIRLDSKGGYAGFGEKFCEVKEIEIPDEKTLSGETNVNTRGKYVYLLTRESCKEDKGLYPYGFLEGDQEMRRYDNHADGLALTRWMLLFTTKAKKLWVSTNGVLAINAYLNDREVKIPNKDTLLASYNVDLDVSQGGMIYLRESFDKNILNRANKDIERFTQNANFVVNHCIVISYINIPEHKNSGKRHTFQVILASDGHLTYSILIYKKLSTNGATVGISERFCGWKIFHSAKDSTLLATETNVGEAGKHVHLLTSSSCAVTELYPYGFGNGDTEMVKGDNYAENITLRQPLMLFRENVTNIYISTNGLLSVDNSVTFNVSLPYHQTVLTPYHMDFDTNKGGSIFYRETQDRKILSRAEADVKRLGVFEFKCKQAILVTYINVSHHDVPTQKHIFQVIIASNGIETFGIFNYIRLDRTYAVTGFSGQRCYWMTFNRYTEWSPTFSYYLEDRSNVGIKGKFIFQLSSDICNDKGNVNDRWSADAPFDLKIASMTYTYVTIKWNHVSNTSDSYLMEYPLEFVAIVSAVGQWLSRRYAFRSKYNQIENLKQNTTYQVDLYTQRRGYFFMPGRTSILNRVSTVPLGPVQNLSVRQITSSKATAYWKIPEVLLLETVVARLRISHSYGESGVLYTVTNFVSICEEQFDFNGTVGSTHALEVTPVIDGIFGPATNVSHTFTVDFTEDDDSKSTTILIIIVTVTTVLLGIISSAFIYYKKSHKRKFESYLMPAGTVKLDPNKAILEQCNNLRYDVKFEFSRKKVNLIRTIGEGAFGQVWMATAEGMESFKPREAKKPRSVLRRLSTRNMKKTIVAVKCLKGNATEGEYKDLANEIKLLIHLGEHRNVVNLLAACTKGESLLAILEYCAKGSLQDYLKLHRDQFDPTWVRHDDEDLNLYDLTWICVQVANGMDFLEQQKCVHRDLAARNVLLTENMDVKISDFGLARDTDNKSFYLKESDGLLPVKWMAPEAIVDRMYTSKSDAWSFAVMMWEVYTLGSVPYSSIKNIYVVDYLKTGQRMKQPKHCPVTVYELMLQCWSMLPKMRMSFSELRNRLDQILLTNETSALGGVSMARILNFENKSLRVINYENEKDDLLKNNEEERRCTIASVDETSENDTTEAYLFLTDEALN